MNRVGFAIAALAASVAKHYMTKVLTAQFEKAFDKKIAEQNAPAN